MEISIINKYFNFKHMNYFLYLLALILLFSYSKSESSNNKDYSNQEKAGNCPTWCKNCTEFGSSKTRVCTVCWDDKPVKKINNETYCNNVFCAKDTTPSYCSHCDFHSKKCYGCQGNYRLMENTRVDDTFCLDQCPENFTKVWNSLIDGWKCHDNNYESKEDVIK